MEIAKILRFLDNQLKIREIEDTSQNGLQVQGKREISKIGLAVDSDTETLKKAKANSCDMLIVHHGLFWSDNSLMIGLKYNRVKFLVENSLALYACHLPLDMHEEYGNNISLARMIGLKGISPFGYSHGFSIGFRGEAERMPVERLAGLVDSKLGSNSKIHQFREGPAHRVGIISGSGGSGVYECPGLGVDTLLTGEVNYHRLLDARELGINVIEAGHYHTETIGLKRLMDKVKEVLGVECVFIESRKEL
jgi:dinuclear metal center YbgI/SA1388 family protein